MNIGQRNRLIVTGSLFVLLISASIIFGANVLIIGLVGLITSVIIELLASKARKEKFDWTSFWITPLIITLLTTPTIIDQVWMIAVATAFGVFFGKSIWGGQDKNVFNPAMIGLIFIALAFPIYVNSFLDPILKVSTTVTPAFTFKNTPAAVFNAYSIWQLLIGNYAGGLGTTFKLGILVLGSILMILRISDWKIPLTFLGTYFLFSLINFSILGYKENAFIYALYSLLMGHLLFSAMFVSTDPQTSPMYTKGKIIYGMTLGFVTWIIQNIWIFNKLAPNTEGIIYSVTFMNAMVGLIDVWTVPKIKNVPLMEEVSE